MSYRKPVIISVFLTFVFVMNFVISCGNDNNEYYKIGWIGPLSGDNAVYGKMVQSGTEIAVEEINELGGVKGKKIMIIYEDDQLQPQKGVNAINKLIEVDKVPIVIQAIGSTVMLAQAPIAEENKIVLISPTCTADKITDAGDFIFRISPKDSDQGRVIADYAYNKLGYKKSGVLYINNAYGAGLKDNFIKSFKELGGSVETEEAFLDGDTDFRAQLLKNDIAGVSFIALLGHYQQAAQILKQAKELALDFQFIGPDGCFAPDLIRIAGNAAEGFMVTNFGWDYNSDRLLVRNFISKFEQKYNKYPEVQAVYGYDCIRVIEEALKNSEKYNGESLKEALYRVKFEGLTGFTAFDEYGDVQKTYNIYIINNGLFEIINE